MSIFLSYVVNYDDIVTPFPGAMLSVSAGPLHFLITVTSPICLLIKVASFAGVDNIYISLYL
jgi:hypothetical protein